MQHPVIDVDVTHHRVVVTDRYSVRAFGEEAAGRSTSAGAEPDDALHGRELARERATITDAVRWRGHRVGEVLDLCAQFPKLTVEIPRDAGDAATWPDRRHDLDDVQAPP